MTVFSPGGSPTDTSEILIGLMPYSRSAGKEIPWPERNLRIRDIRIENVDKPLHEAKGQGTKE
jgi:hypothetical protein